jgi:hypothetical protein
LGWLFFYGLPDDFPGFLEARGPGHPHAQVATLEEQFAVEIQNSKFIPFFTLLGALRGDFNLIR